MIWQLRQRWISVSVALLTLTFGMAVVADCFTPRCKEHTVKGALESGDTIQCNKTGHSICWVPTIRSNADLGEPTECIDHATITVEMWLNCSLDCEFQCGPGYIDFAPYAGNLAPTSCPNSPSNPKRRFCKNTDFGCGAYGSWNEEHDEYGGTDCD